MWIIDGECAVPCCSEDCLPLMVVPKVDEVSRLSYLELLPKFRYNVRVSGMSLLSFRETAARLLFSHNVVLAVGQCSRSGGEEKQEEEVSSVVLVNMSPRILRVAHGKSDVSICDSGRWDGGSGKRGYWGGGGSALWGKGSSGSNGPSRADARDSAQVPAWKKHQMVADRREAQEEPPLSDASERSSNSPAFEES